VPNFLASIQPDAGCQLCSLAGHPMTSHRLGDLSCPQLSPADRSYIESLQNSLSKIREAQRHDHDQVKIFHHPHCFHRNRFFNPFLVGQSNIFIVAAHVTFLLLRLQKRRNLLLSFFRVSHAFYNFPHLLKV
jgi:hypothetical protein